MNKTKEKISTFQFFSLIYLSRVLTTVTYIPSYTKDIKPSDMFFNIIMRILFGLLVIVPVFMLYKRNSDENVIGIMRNRSPLLAKITAILYAAAFFYFTVSTIARLDVFSGTIIFPETNVNYLLIFVVIACCYGAYMGLQALGRSAVLSLFAVVPAMIFVVAMLVNKIDFLNFSPIFYNGVMPVVKSSFNAAGRTAEYLAVAVALPKVVGNNKKGYVTWIFLQTLTTAALFFTLAGVMGNFTNTQLFPLHTLSSVANFSFFERLDALFTGLWIICAFLKISFFIYLSVTILQKEFGGNFIKYLVPLGILLAVFNLFISKSIDRFMMLDSSLIKLIITLTMTFIIPLAVLIFTHKKEENKCEKHLL